MQGDFTRDTFNPLKHFRRVLMQQGRVMLDADFNEQTALILHYLQALATDLLGWHAGSASGFRIDAGETNDFAIGRGHYYVEGVLCDNGTAAGAPLTYLEQPYFTPVDTEEDLDTLANIGTRLLVYLDVWERHISHVEDAVLNRPTIPGIREVALGGPDTTSRAQLVWQVKCVPIEDAAITATVLSNLATPEEFHTLLLDMLASSRLNAETHIVRPGTGRLRARAFRGPQPTSADPCITPPNAGYRGNDNRLYRVEIHRWGDTVAAAPNPVRTNLTFKWSRENGSVLFPLREPLTPDIALVASLGRDSRSGLEKGDWVEILDDDLVLRNQRGPICRVEHIDLQARRVRLARPGEPKPGVGTDLKKHPLLRRWDHRPNQAQPTAAQLDAQDQALKVVVSRGEDQGWLTLEDGVQVQFEPGGTYRSGDYWLIPARVATGNVEWPLDEDGEPVFVPPHGLRHYYAPLAIATMEAAGKIKAENCRHLINKLWT